MEHVVLVNCLKNLGNNNIQPGTKTKHLIPFRWPRAGSQCTPGAWTKEKRRAGGGLVDRWKWTDLMIGKNVTDVSKYDSPLR